MTLIEAVKKNDPDGSKARAIIESLLSQQRWYDDLVSIGWGYWQETGPRAGWFVYTGPTFGGGQ